MSSLFVRRLRREMAASPKKAGLLALLLVIALWFWAPLVMKSFSKGDTAAVDVARTPGSGSGPVPMPVASGSGATAVASAPSQSINNVKSRLPGGSWKQRVAQIRRDPRMSPATELISARDPFKVPVVEAPTPKKRETPVAKQSDFTPASAGLVLNSTLVGRGQKRALIGGEVYEEGNTIAAADGESGFRIVEIRPREVILERKGRLYNLSLPQNEWAKER